MSCCWDPKRDDAENEKNNYKTDEGNREGKYKHFAWANLMYKNEFLVKRLISKKKKEKRKKKKRKELISLFLLLVRFAF